MLIEIKGVQFVNKGAELMLHAILQKAKELWPQAEFCLAPNANSPYLKRAQLGTYQKLSIRKNVIDLNGLFYFVPKFLRQRLKSRWGIVTEADIDVVLDASGFSYGDQWSTLILRQTATEIVRLKKHNKHYIFLSQALGPFTQKDNIKWAKVAFEQSSYVFAREQQSLAFAKLVAPNANIMQAPDFTNLLSPKICREYHFLEGAVAIIPNSKMLSTKNLNIQWRSRYIDIMALIINVLIKNKQQVFLLNHEGNDDFELCQQINSHLSDPIEIIAPNDALQVKAIIGECKLVVCSRYHGCVSALSQLVPCFATSWSHKYEELFIEYEQESMILSADILPDELKATIESVLLELPQIKYMISSPAQKYIHQTNLMWQKIEKIVEV